MGKIIIIFVSISKNGKENKLDKLDLEISSLDKQRICVITQYKSSKKQLNVCVYQKAIPPISMQLHTMSLHTIWSISFPFG